MLKENAKNDEYNPAFIESKLSIDRHDDDSKNKYYLTKLVLILIIINGILIIHKLLGISIF